MKKFFNACFILWVSLILTGCVKEDTAETKLQVPYSLKVSSGYVLTWSIVKGAVAYLPNINGVDCEAVTSNQLMLSDVVEGGHLSIKVKAIADGEIRQDSDWSEVLEFDMAVALAAPQLVVTRKIVSWEAVEGASTYEYEINGSIVITESTTIDLSGYLAETYTIKVRAIPADNKLNSTSIWSNEVTVAIFDRLATPQLIVNGSSLKNPDSPSITWSPVNGASGYEVLIDGVKSDVIGTVIDFTGQIGTFNVKVTAVNPGLYDASETAEADITVREYGKGTVDNPYMIYTVQDWKDFSDNVSTNEGISGYTGKYLELASDIDFENLFVNPAGVSALLSFKGTLDGKDFTLKNAKIGDGTTSHQAFFYLLNGTVKNLKFDNITVTGGNATGAASSAAVITAGQSTVAFTIENCHVSNSTVTSGGGSYAAGLVGRCNNSAVLISDCSVSKSTIIAGKENAGGIVGFCANGTLAKVLSSENTVIAQNNGNSAGVVGSLSGGTVTGVIASGNIVSGQTNVAGVIGNFSEGAITDVLASENNISGTSVVGGVVGTMAGVSLINVISADNVASVQSAICGGVVGQCTSADGEIVNIYSKGNTVKCLNHANYPYLGLIVGTNGNKVAYAVKNTLTLSGSADYIFDTAVATDKKYAGTIGIVLGYGASVVLETGYYFKGCQSLYDAKFYAAKGTEHASTNALRFATGVKQNSGTANSRAGEEKDFVAKTADELASGSVLTELNDWVKANKETYPSLKVWVEDASGYPKL